MAHEHLDGCELDFSREPLLDDELESLLVPEDEQDKPSLLSRMLLSVTGGRDLTLADRLRKDGLNVREVSGWKTRGQATLNPRGALTHHTAGAPRSAGVAPSLGIIINGRSDLPGPLANVYIDYDGVVYVVASGKANHAGIIDNGVVSWAPDGSGNSMVWGLEVEHPGTFPLPADIADVAARVQAAVVRGTVGADRVIYHKEWAPSRKIDLATAPSPSEHRQLVAHHLTNSSEEENEMTEKFKAWVLWRLTEKADPARKPSILNDFIPTEQDWQDASWIHELVGLYGEHTRYMGWRAHRLLDAAKPASTPARITRRWWDAINADLTFANAYADKADDPLQAKLAESLEKVAFLQNELDAVRLQLEHALEAGSAQVQELLAREAEVKALLEQALAKLETE